jgi:hypothetical protein
VIEHPGFFLSQDDNPPRTVGKSLEHRVIPALHHLAPRSAPRTFKPL